MRCIRGASNIREIAVCKLWQQVEYVQTTMRFYIKVVWILRGETGK